MEFSREELKGRRLKDFFKDDEEKMDSNAIKQEEDIFDEEPAGFNIKYLVSLILVAVICFVSYAWYTDKFAISRTEGVEIPIIKADKNPVRKKPDDPGGMYVANRDKAVYGAMSKDSTVKLPEVTRIRPKAEEPVDRQIIKRELTMAELLEDIETDELKEKAEKFIKREEKAKNEVILPPLFDDGLPKANGPEQEIPKYEVILETVESESLKDTKDEIKSAKIEAKETNVKAKESALKKDKAKKKPKELTVEDIKIPSPVMRSKPVVSKRKADSGYKVQLGAFRLKSEVSSSWNAMVKKHPKLLGGMKYFVEKADLGKKGVFYRLKVGSLKESDARKLCKELTEKKQGCLFVGK